MSATSSGGASGAVPLVEVTRRDVASDVEYVESVHHGHLVHVADGAAVRTAGVPDVAVLPRSAVKPLQAAACLGLIAEVDAPLAAALSDAELAIGWASHRAEPDQLAAVRTLLGRVDLAEDVLTCPRGGVADDPAAPRTPLAHMCSGKHALFAVTARVLGLATDRATLLDADGPLQSRVLAQVADWLGPPLGVAVDGCGAPAVVVPLDALAHATARLATAEGDLGRVRRAGLAHPLLVGGSERRAGGGRVPLVDSALLAAGVVAKRGAEGVLIAGWRDADGRGHGLAVKALDGSLRGAATAAVAELAAAGAVDADVWEASPPQGGGSDAGTVRAVVPDGS